MSTQADLIKRSIGSQATSHIREKGRKFTKRGICVLWTQTFLKGLPRYGWISGWKVRLETDHKDYPLEVITEISEEGFRYFVEDFKMVWTPDGINIASPARVSKDLKPDEVILEGRMTQIIGRHRSQLRLDITLTVLF